MPELVLASGKKHTLSPCRNDSAIAWLIGSMSLRLLRSMKIVPAFATILPMTHQFFSSFMAIKPDGYKLLITKMSSQDTWLATISVPCKGAGCFKPCRRTFRISKQCMLNCRTACCRASRLPAGSRRMRHTARNSQKTSAPKRKSSRQKGVECAINRKP